MGLEHVEGACFRLAEQQVEVFRHEDVAERVEAMSLPELFEGGEEDRAGVIVVEIRTTAVTAKGNEVVVTACPPVTLRPVGTSAV